MKMLTKMGLGAALALALAGPGVAQDTAATDTTAKTTLSPDTVVAVVNGEKITVGHMALARAGLDKQYQQYPPDVLFKALRDQLIRQVLLEQSIKDIPPQLHYLIENQDRQMIASEAVGQIADKGVTEEAVKAAYDKDYASAEPTKEYNASHILVASKEEADAALKRANDGEDFAALARELSTGPTGKNGGALGWFGAEQMVQPFSDAVVKMKPGEIAGPVQTQFGWHVIKLNDERTKPVPPLEQVRADIEKKLRQDVAQKAVESMEAKADIEKTDNLDPAAVLDGSAFQSE